MTLTTDQAKRALALLRSILSDIDTMRNREDYFGGFIEWTTDSSDAAVIEWPNLSIMGRDIAEFLATVTEQENSNG